MASLVIAGDSSGSITVSAPSAAGSTVITLPAQTGTATVSGPAFSAYLSANQTVTSGTTTLLTLNTELFDTASCFNNTGSTVGGIPAYAFLPNVAGYYQVNFAVGATAGTTLTYAGSYIFKNGSGISRNLGAAYSGTNGDTMGSRLVYMNGTTDYLQFYGQAAGTGTITIVGTSEDRTVASACFVRPA
jgi:hypothetical protein